MNWAKYTACGLACYEYLSWREGHHTHDTGVLTEARVPRQAGEEDVTSTGKGPTLLWLANPYIYILILFGLCSLLLAVRVSAGLLTMRSGLALAILSLFDSHLICQGLGNQIRELIRIWSEIRWRQAWESVPEHRSVNFWMPLTPGQLA